LSSTTGSLKIDNGANINAAGGYLIDAGLVHFRGSGDELDGAGPTFTTAYATHLTIVDVANTQGTVTVQGAVPLAAATTTTMNYKGRANTADVLDVRKGSLSLNGSLYLVSLDGSKPTQGTLSFL
jgi:hypothetical protein